MEPIIDSTNPTKSSSMMLPSSRLRVKLRVDVKAVAAESLRGWLMISWVVMNLPFIHWVAQISIKPGLAPTKINGKYWNLQLPDYPRVN